MKRWISFGLMCLTLLTVSKTTLAADSRIKFQHDGIISNIFLKKNTILINDSEFSLSPTVRVYTQNGAASSMTSLKKGMRVGVILSNASSGHASYVTEIWMLPDNFLPLGTPPSR